ncbi:hypothetical protein Taro_049279, partial [Colocasia esculenta]|nr:hypothetical protein [Colocasia esculenta]
MIDVVADVGLDFKALSRYEIYGRGLEGECGHAENSLDRPSMEASSAWRGMEEMSMSYGGDLHFLCAHRMFRTPHREGKSRYLHTERRDSKNKWAEGISDGDEPRDPEFKVPTKKPRESSSKGKQPKIVENTDEQFEPARYSESDSRPVTPRMVKPPPLLRRTVSGIYMTERANTAARADPGPAIEKMKQIYGESTLGGSIRSGIERFWLDPGDSSFH